MKYEFILTDCANSSQPSVSVLWCAAPKLLLSAEFCHGAVVAVTCVRPRHVAGHLTLHTAAPLHHTHTQSTTTSFKTSPILKLHETDSV